MQQRAFGGTSVRTSLCTFGPMRLDPSKTSIGDAVRLLDQLRDGGVTTVHVSREYESHAFFCEALRRARASRPWPDLCVVCKLAVPHFDEPAFSGARLRALVDDALRELDVPRLDIVQWLLRTKPIEDAARLGLLDACSGELGAEWQSLVDAGKVAVLASFPYSMAFAQRVLEASPCSGLVTYLNLAELDAARFLDGMFDAGRGLIAIRPLFAGALASGGQAPTADAALDALGVPTGDRVAFALRFPLLHPAVSSVVLSVSTAAHAAAALAALAQVEPDRPRFATVVRTLVAARPTMR